MIKIKGKFIISIIIICTVFIGVLIYSYISYNLKQSYKSNLQQGDSRNKEIKSGGFFKAFDYIQSLKINTISGKLDVGPQMLAWHGVQQLAKRKAGSLGFDWQELGPDNIGGRSRCILIDKNNANLIYAGSVSGGLWKSESAGASWIKVSEFNESFVVTCMVQDKDGNIYVGTGEGFYIRYGTGTGGFMGKGVFYKASASAAFSQLPATLPSAGTQNVDWAFVNNLACDPITGRVYAATSTGLFFSDDKGSTWTNPLSPNKSFCQDVEVASDQTVVAVINNRPYVCTAPNASPLVFTESVSGLPTTNLVRTEIAIAPNDPNYIYACIAKTYINNNGEAEQIMDGVYKSIDKGATWSKLVVGSTDAFKPLGAQGGYDNEIVVDPDNKEKIFVGGLDMWTWSPGTTWTKISLWNEDQTSPFYVHADHHKYVFHPTNHKIMYLATDGGIFKTMDGGNSFISLNKNFVSTQFYSLAYTLSGQVFGGAQDNGTLYINGAGNSEKSCTQIRTGDGGNCYASMINPSAFFVSYIKGDILRSSDKGVTLQGVSDNETDHGKFFSKRLLTTDGKLNFKASFTSPFDMWESITDYASPDSLTYTAIKDQKVGDTIIVRSVTGNYPFRYITSKAIAKGEKIKVKDIVQSRFYLGVENAVWMTREALDFTKTPEWFKISKISGQVQSLAHSKDGNYLFVGTESGKLYRIKNLTIAVDSMSADIADTIDCVVKTELIKDFGNRAVTSIAVDPQNTSHVLVTLGNYGNTSYVYRTINSIEDSVGFVSCQGNLPKMPVYASLILNMHSDTVLVGTEYGLYSTNSISSASVNWTSENTSPMDPVAVYQIRQQTMVIPSVKNLGVIYIASHGRGFFKSDLFIDTKTMSVKQQPLLASQLNVYPNPVNDKLTVSYDSDGSSSTEFKMYDLNGRVVLSSTFDKTVSGKSFKTIDCSSLQTGTYFIRLTQGTAKISAKVIVSH